MADAVKKGAEAVKDKASGNVVDFHVNINRIQLYLYRSFIRS
jgi:hypothetical protein